MNIFDGIHRFAPTVSGFTTAPPTPNAGTPSKTPFTAVVTIATKTYTPEVSRTATRTSTPTRSLTPTRTLTPTKTPSKSPTPTLTPTPSLTPTPTLTATETETPTPAATSVGTCEPGETWTFYYYAGSDRIALRVSQESTSEVYYLFGDHLGSTRVVMKADGSVQGVEKYKAFGEKRYPESRRRLLKWWARPQVEKCEVDHGGNGAVITACLPFLLWYQPSLRLTTALVKPLPQISTL